MAFTQAGRQAPRDRLTPVFAVAAIAVSIVVKLGLGAHAPLWLDETWTGAIISQPTAHAFFDQVYWDVNAPLYYLLMALWRLAFGVSDWALRAPSIAFSLTAPLLPLMFGGAWNATGQGEGLSWPIRLCWAGLLALWAPGLAFADEARCYALLLLLCTAQALAFLRMTRAPSLGQALVWATVSTLAILTHYHALLMTGLEGAVFIALRWRQARRLWPALVVFLPAAVWLLAHAPRIAEFARPSVAWYSLLGWGGPALVVGAAVAAPGFLPILFAVLLITAAIGRLSGVWPKADSRSDGAIMLSCAGVVGVGIIAGLGMVRPSFAIRYLTPFAPACLLGLVILFSWLGQSRAPVGRAVILAVYMGLAAFLGLSVPHTGVGGYSSGPASQFVAAARPKRLVFLLDDPNSAILHDAQLVAVGGFFFKRAHVQTAVEPLVLHGKDNPNVRLVAETRPGDAFIWMYDRGAPGVRATVFPPTLQGSASGFRCRQFAAPPQGVLACVRNAPPKEGAQT